MLCLSFMDLYPLENNLKNKWSTLGVDPAISVAYYHLPKSQG